MPFMPEQLPILENSNRVEADWDSGVYARLLSQLLHRQIRVSLAGASDCISAASLSSKERQQYEFLPHRRRQNFLLGRTALKQLLVMQGDDGETGSFSFPTAGYSLSHSAGRSIAVSCFSGAVKSNIGVDIEAVRRLHPSAAKFFLSRTEREWFSTCGDGQRSNELIRLWTVKEALFKANTACADRSLVRYEVLCPGAFSGEARHELSGSKFCYATLISGEFYVSCAVREEN